MFQCVRVAYNAECVQMSSSLAEMAIRLCSRDLSRQPAHSHRHTDTHTKHSFRCRVKLHSNTPLSYSTKRFRVNCARAKKNLLTANHVKIITIFYGFHAYPIKLGGRYTRHDSRTHSLAGHITSAPYALRLLRGSQKNG